MRFSRYVVDNELSIATCGCSLLFAWALKKLRFFRSWIFFEYPFTVLQIQAYMHKCITPSFAVRLRLHASLSNGDGEIRTLDPLLARQVLSQLSYIPIIWRPPALPHRLQCSTFGRSGLNRRVRDGNGCFPQAHRHQKYVIKLLSLITQQ